jgi:hypothetical protein
MARASDEMNTEFYLVSGGVPYSTLFAFLGAVSSSNASFIIG